MSLIEKFARVLKLATMVSIAIVIFAGCKDEEPKSNIPKTVDIIIIGYNYCCDNDEEYTGTIFLANGKQYICYTEPIFRGWLGEELKGGFHRIDTVNLNGTVYDMEIIGNNSIICAQNTMDDLSWVSQELKEVKVKLYIVPL